MCYFNVKGEGCITVCITYVCIRVSMSVLKSEDLFRFLLDILKCKVCSTERYQSSGTYSDKARINTRLILKGVSGCAVG